MKKKQTIAQLPTRSPNYLLHGLTLTAGLTALWGVAVALSIYLESEFLMNLAHFPFWMMIGLLGTLLNYIPIAKSKPKLIPLVAIGTTIATAAWFCFDNFIEINGAAAIFDRLRLGTGLLITCYCLTHISLLMLAYRKESSNLLLILTGGVVTLSGISYIILLWGIVPGENFALVLMGTISLFFIKFALTVTTVLLSLNYPKKPASDDQLKSFPTQPAAKLNI